jgi:hypothetical protein
MKKIPKHEIELLLNSSGYTGGDLDKVIPDFFSDRDVKVGLVHIPSFNGPDSWVINIIIGTALGKIGEVFLSEIIGDLYNWSKTKLVKFFDKKPNSVGFIKIKFNDLQIFCYEYYIPKDKFLEVFKEIPNLINQIDKQKGKIWIVKFDQENGKWSISADR